jgi:G3E family GTPase
MEKIPVYLITGFLGAGKTTLLNHLLEQSDEEVAVIVNEFGEVGIDDRILLRSDEEIMELTTGSICCMAKNDTIKVLTRLADNKDRKFKKVFIETTGLANPGNIISAFAYKAALKDQYRFAGTITVIDAYHIIQQITERPEANDQIAMADILILNKTDIADDIEAVRDLIKRVNPIAKIIETNFSNIELSDLEGLEAREIDLPEEHGHAHDSDIDSIALETKAPIDLQKFGLWVATEIMLRKDDLLRYKGILNIDGMNERFVFQGVHEHFSNTKERPWGEQEARDSKIVLIGRNLDKSVLEASLQETLA